VSRLPHALAAALALHGLLFFVRARHSLHPSAPPAARAPELVEIEAPDVEPAPEVASASDPEHASARASTPSAGAIRAARSPQTSEASPDNAPPSADANNGNSDAPAGPSAVASVEPPARKVDLGLDGQFFMRPPSEQLPRVHKSEFQHQLEVSISADDVKHGLARGNAFLGSLNAAVREAGPTRGEALLRVTVGPDGALSEVEFLHGTAADWAGALQSFRQIASRKRARLPAGSRGLRVTFSVKAKVQLPSGTEVKGVDVASPSLAPNGLTLHGTFDVADTGAGAQRLVYAHVVSEEVL
jgi:hypothetical protein